MLLHLYVGMLLGFSHVVVSSEGILMDYKDISKTYNSFTIKQSKITTTEPQNPLESRLDSENAFGISTHVSVEEEDGASSEKDDLSTGNKVPTFKMSPMAVAGVGLLSGLALLSVVAGVFMYWNRPTSFVYEAHSNTQQLERENFI